MKAFVRGDTARTETTRTLRQTWRDAQKPQFPMEIAMTDPNTGEWLPHSYSQPRRPARPSQSPSANRSGSDRAAKAHAAHENGSAHCACRDTRSQAPHIGRA